MPGDDIDWLFKTRDDVVHHGERHGPLLVGRTTNETVVYSGAESFNLSAPFAARAASLVIEVVVACLDIRVQQRGHGSTIAGRRLFNSFRSCNHSDKARVADICRARFPTCSVVVHPAA